MVLFSDHCSFSLHFASASDDGLFSDDVLEARCTKEADSLKQWRADVGSLTSFSDLHWWLHQTHQCYAVARQGEFEKVTIQDPRLLASY